MNQRTGPNEHLDCEYYEDSSKTYYNSSLSVLMKKSGERKNVPDETRVSEKSVVFKMNPYLIFPNTEGNDTIKPPPYKEVFERKKNDEIVVSSEKELLHRTQKIQEDAQTMGVNAPKTHLGCVKQTNW